MYKLSLLAAANGPTIDQGRFHSFQPFVVICVFSLFCAFVIMRWGVKVTPNTPVTNVGLNVLSLLFVATAATALASTPRMQLILGFIQALENDIRSGIGRSGVQIGVSAIALILVLLAGIWYNRTEGLLPVVVFALLFMVLASSSAQASQFLTWFTNNVVSSIQNLAVDVANWFGSK